MDTGLTSVSNPMEGKSVYYKGETVEIKFKASAAWTADLEFKQGEGWAQITRTKGNDAAGDGSVRLNFDANETGEERTVVLWVKVNGRADNLGIEIRQAGQPESSAMSEFLNAYMDEILAEDYLWAEQYRAPIFQNSEIPISRMEDITGHIHPTAARDISIHISRR